LNRKAESSKKSFNIQDVSPSQTAIQSEPANKDTQIPQKIKPESKKTSSVGIINNNTNIVNGATNYNVAGSTEINNNAALVDKQYFSYG
jgi:hypothetical protein